MSKVKVGNITDSCLGKMLDAEKNKGDYEPYLANVNVRWGSFDLDNLSQMKFEPDEQVRYGLNDGDLIMCEGGEPGRCAIWHNEVPNMKIQKALHRIRPHDCLDIRFLYYWFLLAGRTGWLSRYFTETTIKHLPGESLKDVELDLPKLSIQQGIADVLSAIDDKIILNKRINAELEAMAKTIYDYWFVQFDFPNENGKPYRTSGGAMKWNEQLKREIPKGWNVATLSKYIAEEKGGDWGKEKETDNYAEKVTCIRGADFPALNGLQNLKAPTRYILRKNINKHLRNGDIIVEISGGSPTQSTGRVSYINDEILKRFSTDIIASNFCRAFSLVDIAYQYWFYVTWTTLYNSGVFFKYEGKTTGIKNLLFDFACADYAIVCPPSMVIKQYNRHVEPLFIKVQKNIIENDELTRLRDWLLPMLMNGQATVADEEPIETPQNVVEMPDNNKRFDLWLQNQGIAARGDLDKKTLREIFDAMDDDDK